MRTRDGTRLDQGIVHLIGIGGIGVSAVAKLLLARGVHVRGSDVRASQLTAMLQALGADVRIGHDASHLDGVAVVVVSTAIPETNPELVAARARQIPVIHRSHVLGALLEEREAIGIIGTHGKGTTSGAIAWLLDADGRAPGFVIGGLLENWRDNARDGATTMVAEIDESDGSLINSRPTVALLNNLELDHLNYYKDWPQLQAMVETFFLDNPRLEVAVFNRDDEGASRILASVGGPLSARGVRVLTFGFEAPAGLPAPDVRGVDLQGQRMRGNFHVSVAKDADLLPEGVGDDLPGQRVGLGQVAIGLPGAYNAGNILGALTVAMALGVPFHVIQAAAPNYRGLENRYTLVEADGIEIVKDYISHPTGIRRVLEAASAQRPAALAQIPLVDSDEGEPPSSELVAVFKPYRFTMIHYLQDDYALAFAGADRVVVTELYTAGEVPIPGVDTDMLCRRIRERCPRVEYVHDMDAIPAHLEATTQRPATVLFFGGDDLFRMADRWVAQRLKAQAGSSGRGEGAASSGAA